METRHSDRTQLEKHLAKTKEPDAPPWLVPRIMAEINDRKPSIFEGIRTWWFHSRSVGFVPAWLALTVTVVFSSFWLGTITERNRLPDDSGAGKAVFPAIADNAEANYMIGRGLLAAGHGDQALAFLGQAVRQEPGTAEFIHWQGVAYWTVGETDQERQSYLYSVQEEPSYVPSLLNLGHNYLESGEYQKALAQYDKVLEVAPDDASALYNRALAFLLLEDDARAKQTFLSYLDHHRTGKWVFRAIEHLHRLGDFTFRSYRVGGSHIVLNTQALLHGDAPAQQQEMRHLAEAAARVTDSDLHLVVYHQGDRNAAKATAKALQQQLNKYLDIEQAKTVKISWFDVLENFEDANGVERQLTTSLLVFTKSMENFKMRNSI